MTSVDPIGSAERWHEPTLIDEIRYGFAIAGHHVSREFRSRYRRAVFGWVWAVGQPLLRFLVLLFAFTQLVDVGIERFPEYLFSGIVFWFWFASGVAAVTSSPHNNRDLLLRPGLPRWSLPLTAALVEGIDLVAALPVMLLLLILGGGVPLVAPLILLTLIVELLLILGIGMLVATVNVYFHDARIVVDLVLQVGFYLTPIIYVLDFVPETYRWIIRLNPMTHILDAQRFILLDGTMPNWADFGMISAVSLGVFLLGLGVYQRASRKFLDQL